MLNSQYPINKKHNPNHQYIAISCFLSLILLPFFQVSAASDNSLYSSEFNIELSSEAQNAINNGVALTLESEYARTKQWLKWSWHTDKKKHHFVVMRHALSNRYLVKQDQTEVPKIFRSIPEALDFVAYQAFLLLESYNNQADQHVMRVYLNKFKLPSPMRLNAFLSEAWDYNSGWQHWQ